MKKIFFFSIICLSVNFASGQSNTSSEDRAKALNNDPKFVEFKKRHDDVTAKRNQSVVATSYFGYDETLKSYFIGSIIPSETPKAGENISKSEYVKILNQWISQNKNLLKPEHKNSLISE